MVLVPWKKAVVKALKGLSLTSYNQNAGQKVAIVAEYPNTLVISRKAAPVHIEWLRETQVAVKMRALKLYLRMNKFTVS